MVRKDPQKTWVSNVQRYSGSRHLFAFAREKELNVSKTHGLDGRGKRGRLKLQRKEGLSETLERSKKIRGRKRKTDSWKDKRRKWGTTQSKGSGDWGSTEQSVDTRGSIAYKGGLGQKIIAGVEAITWTKLQLKRKENLDKTEESFINPVGFDINRSEKGGSRSGQG